jgi:hypothetical protein
VAVVATTILKLLESIKVIWCSVFRSTAGTASTAVAPEKVTKSSCVAPCAIMVTITTLELVVVVKQLLVAGEVNVALIGVMSL